jgi:hypothetical protein
MIYFILIILLVILLLYYFIDTKYENFENLKNSCDLNIDNIKITKRDKTYSKLINKLIDEKSILFNDDQIKVMKNTNQYYHVDNDNELNNIKNISEKIYLDCKQNFDSNLNNNGEIIPKKYENPEYNEIKDKLEQNIINSSSYKGNNIDVLNNKNYLKNYYLDVFGNRVESNLEDYFANYFTTIDDEYGQEPKESIKVKIIEGNPYFIIPNQYNNNKHMTNAYNVDWSRIINPLVYY